MKWWTVPFPWFDNILELLGETLATGRYSFHGGGVLEDEDDFLDDEDGNVDPLLRSTPATSSPATSSRPSTAVLGTQTEDEDDLQTEPLHQKHSRQSGPAQTGTKKAKITGVGMMEKMGDGILAMAEAIAKPLVEPQALVKEMVDSTLQGQAQEKVQDEACLTEAGQLLMITRFTDPVLARTYLSLKKDSLRVLFFRKQLENEEGDYFIDWES
jgi:hypothetical protein